MTTAPEERGQRVQKILAAAGIGSRRACDDLVAQGRVTIDGETAIPGARAQAASVITVDGQRVHSDPSLVYYLLNKPVGYVTTASDPEGRPTVMDLVPPNPRVYPVGRLDQHTEGMLLLTNDGDLAHRLTHPSFAVEKVYVAELRGKLRGHQLKALTDGVELEDGPARAVSARELTVHADRSLVELVLVEGRKREVRRMLEAVGTPVQRLARVRIGPVPLGEIGTGKLRPLTSAEVGALQAAVGLTAGTRAS